MPVIEASKLELVMDHVSSNSSVFEAALKGLKDSKTLKNINELTQVLGNLGESITGCPANIFTFLCGFEFGYQYYKMFGEGNGDLTN